MTEQELEQKRREKWRLAGDPIRTLDAARDFIESVGFCVMYPLTPQQARGAVAHPDRQPILLPSFIGAWVGGDDRLPTWKQAFADPRAQDATELMVRQLRDRAAYEANLFGETNFLIAASVFPFFYALVGDRNPKQPPPERGAEAVSPLSREVFDVIRQGGAMNKEKLRLALGRELSPAALDRALNELWSRLRITRVDYRAGEGGYWDVLYRWAPEAVRAGVRLSVPEALSALLSKYLDALIAAEAPEIESFFGQIVARSKVREAVNALLAARELSMLRVGQRNLLQVAPPREVEQRQRVR
jgi:hypothetical protein